MARCESCGGPIRGANGTGRPADELIDVNKFVFDDRVGGGRARRTHFCSAECAIRGLQDGLINEPDDSMFWVDRRGDGPQNYPDPETEPLVRRAKELLETASDGVDDQALDSILDDAIQSADDALDELEDVPDPDDRVHVAAGDALRQMNDGKPRLDAVDAAAVEYNIVDRVGAIYGEVKKATDCQGVDDAE